AGSQRRNAAWKKYVRVGQACSRSRPRIPARSRFVAAPGSRSEQGPRWTWLATGRSWFAGAAGEQRVRIAFEVVHEPGDGLGGLAELLDGRGGLEAETGLGVDEALRRGGGVVEGREGGARLLQ